MISTTTYKLLLVIMIVLLVFAVLILYLITFSADLKDENNNFLSRHEKKDVRGLAKNIFEKLFNIADKEPDQKNEELKDFNINHSLKEKISTMKTKRPLKEVLSVCVAGLKPLNPKQVDVKIVSLQEEENKILNVVDIFSFKQNSTGGWELYDIK